MVTSFALVTACGGDDEGSAGLPNCSDVESSGECQKCKDADGNTDCAGTPGCTYIEQDDYCDDAVA